MKNDNFKIGLTLFIHKKEQQWKDKTKIIKYENDIIEEPDGIRYLNIPKINNLYNVKTDCNFNW